MINTDLRDMLYESLNELGITEFQPTTVLLQTGLPVFEAILRGALRRNGHLTYFTPSEAEFLWISDKFGKGLELDLTPESLENYRQSLKPEDYDHAKSSRIFVRPNLRVILLSDRTLQNLPPLYSAGFRAEKVYFKPNYATLLLDSKANPKNLNLSHTHETFAKEHIGFLYWMTRYVSLQENTLEVYLLKENPPKPTIPQLTYGYLLAEHLLETAHKFFETEKEYNIKSVVTLRECVSESV